MARRRLLLLLSPLLCLLASCAWHRVAERSIAGAESWHREERLSVRQIALPESRADLQVPADGLRRLPPSALYTAKSGQATATVRFLHDTLFVSASCDSLQQLAYDYQQQAERLMARSARLAEEEKRAPPRPLRPLRTAALLAATAWLAWRIGKGRG